jgi:tetratricopeptide (TPR) repeat protein
MITYNPDQVKITLKQKITLVVFGIFLFVILLESGLRIGGYIILFAQEHRNKVSLGQKGAYRIMCLGESTTAMGGEYSYPSQLEGILNRRNMGIKFSVINKGISGTNTAYIVEHLEDNIDEYSPDMVITMMGIMDSGIPDAIVSLRNTSLSNILVFLRSFRTYKLSRLLYLHIITKAKERAINKMEKSGQCAVLFFDMLDLGLKNCFAGEAGSVYGDPGKKNAGVFLKNDIYFVKLGVSYREIGKLDKAEQSFNKAIELNPLNVEAYTGLGRVYTSWGRYLQAEEYFKKAIALRPEFDGVYYDLAWFYANSIFKPDLAEEYFKKVIKMDPKNSRVYHALGGFYRDQKRLAEAVENFKKCIEFDLKADRVWGELAFTYKEMGEDALADQCYKKAIEIAPNFSRYSLMTRNNYIRLKKILDDRGIKLVCVQYPVRSIELLNTIFEGQKGVTFVDNEMVFKEAIKREGFKEYFTDIFAGDFGHCTPKGNRLLAGNIADVILKECFNSDLK